MLPKIHKETASESLLVILHKLMEFSELAAFRLVGGTSLSLQLGHRVSVDIDLFTDADYKSIDFNVIEKRLRTEFSYVETGKINQSNFGRMYFIGQSKEQSIKTDLFYTDTFIRPVLIMEGIRFALIEDIIAMKLDVIARGGRKKDFWDIHELIDHYRLDMMIKYYFEKYPYFEVQDVVKGITNFELADDQDDPVCLKGKAWKLIKLDLEETVEQWKSSKNSS
jgi:predicted nucleotidyltransferase component of viral defense system